MRLKPYLLMTWVALGITHSAKGDGFTLDWFPEPSGLRLINQCEIAGVIREVANVELIQTFSLPSSGSISAIGIALGSAAGTPSLKVSLHRVVQGAVQELAFASTNLPASYFAGIGPQTTPVWVYAEFPGVNPVRAGEQIAVRIQSPFAEIWGPRRDVLPFAELIEIPGTDLAFRVYVTQTGPSLSVASVGTSIVVKWPASLTNGVLETTRSLSSPVIWIPLHSITAETNQHHLTNDSVDRFFRLRIP